MDQNALLGKYLRLREELAGARAAAHRRRVLEDLKQVQLQLARAGMLPFADTQPPDEPESPRGRV